MIPINKLKNSTVILMLNVNNKKGYSKFLISFIQQLCRKKLHHDCYSNVNVQ